MLTTFRQFVAPLSALLLFALILVTIAGQFMQSPTTAGVHASSPAQALSGKNSGPIQGALVGLLPEDSPAYKAGLRSGDIIRSVNSMPIDSPEQYRIALEEHRPGSEITLKIFRDGEEHTIPLAIS